MKWSHDLTAEGRTREFLIVEANWPPKYARTLQVYQSDRGHQAFVNREPAGGGEGDPLRWHISVRGPKRPPSWEELVEAAHDLRPGVCFTIGIPPRSWWMNVHPDVLHLWETADPALIAEYRANSRGHTPT